MGKEKTEFEEKFVSKTEKAKKLWEKRITENTTLSMESVQWMAQRINSLLYLEAYNNQKQSEISKHKSLFISVF